MFLKLHVEEIWVLRQIFWSLLTSSERKSVHRKDLKQVDPLTLFLLLLVVEGLSGLYVVKFFFLNVVDGFRLVLFLQT